MLESFLNNVSGLQACKFINKRLQHRRFPVNIAKFLKTTFLKEHLWGLLLYFGQFKYQILTQSLEKLRTMGDFNFTNFFKQRVIGGKRFCCASYYCFPQFAFGNLFSENCCFCLMLPLRKAPVTAAFAKLFQTTNSRKSY